MTEEKRNLSRVDVEALPQLKELFVSPQVLPDGCYVMTWTEDDACKLIGSLRVSRADGDCFASGDIYQCQDRDGVPDEFPAFPPHDCRFYFAVQSVEARNRDGRRYLTLVIERSSFQFPVQRDKSKSVWAKAGMMTMLLLVDDAPAVNGTFRYSGYVMDGVFDGEIELPAPDACPAVSMAWHAPWLRKAMVDVLLEHEDGTSIFDALEEFVTKIAGQIQWKIAPGIRTRVAVPPNKEWLKSDLHAAMAALRQAAGTGHTFRYAAILVNQIYGKYYGLMFDQEAVDGDLLPREAFAVSCGRKLSGAQAIDAGARYQSLSSVSVAFQHVVAHEFGHVLGGDHDKAGTRFMRPTDEIVGDPANVASPFPGNVVSSYVRSDLLFFQHAPDWVVRPGGERFVHDSSADEASNDSCERQGFFVPEHLTFSVASVRDCFPLGAPVRLELRLIDSSEGNAVRLPNRLGLSVGNIRGWVTDPTGKRRSFRPLLRCAIGGGETGQPYRVAGGGKELSGSVTLLRGGEGALFPLAGPYTIKLEAIWRVGGARYQLETQTLVYVAEARSELHKQAARALFETPEVFLVLAVGTLKNRRGVDALKQALQCDVLLAHYAWSEAKRLHRLAEKFGIGARRRKALRARYLQLLKEGYPVLTQDEAKKLKDLKLPPA